MKERGEEWIRVDRIKKNERGRRRVDMGGQD